MSERRVQEVKREVSAGKESAKRERDEKRECKEVRRVQCSSEKEAGCRGKRCVQRYKRVKRCRE